MGFLIYIGENQRKHIIMKETKTTIERLERKIREMSMRNKELLSKNRSLTAKLRMCSVSESKIEQYMEENAQLEEINCNLKKSVADLELQISKLKSLNTQTKKELDNAREANRRIEMEIEKERCPYRLEDYKSGKDVDRWGRSFFGDDLRIYVNPLSGENLNWKFCYDLMDYVELHHSQLWTEYQKRLKDFIDKKEAELNKDVEEDIYYEINPIDRTKKCAELGREVWTKLMKDESIKRLFIEEARVPIRYSDWV